MRDSTPLIFGETLFDCFADGEVAGGAPFNVAWHLQGLGCPPLLLSRVGDDRRGRELRRLMEGWGLSTAGLQVDARRPTGMVRVEVREGEPSYVIEAGQAYDFIEPPGADVTGFALLYHGTLALRNPVSRRTVEGLIRQNRCPVFVDLNLRSPWWRAEEIPAVLYAARYVKLNRHELRQLVADDDGDLPRQCGQLGRQYGLDLLCITDGANGASLWCGDDSWHTVRPAGDTPVVDTVGAGDAFTAVLLLGLLRHWPLAVTLRRAQDFASAIVGHRGATVNDPDFYLHFLHSWMQS